jgi:hypothetical protein
MSKPWKKPRADGTHEPASTRDPILFAPAHRRMAIGAKRGIKATAAFYIVTLLGFVVTAGKLFDGRSYDVIDIGFMYLAWGVFGGALGGLAAPIARSSVSTIPVMALIFLPLAIAVRVLTSGWAGWNARDMTFIVASCLLMSLLWGPLVWRQLQKKD